MTRCTRCSCLKAVDDFAVDRSKKSGRKSHCRACDNARAKRYYEAHRGAVIARVTARNRAKAAA